MIMENEGNQAIDQLKKEVIRAEEGRTSTLKRTDYVRINSSAQGLDTSNWAEYCISDVKS
jgi:hypothetical protein